jgi:hypothetical protein
MNIMPGELRWPWPTSRAGEHPPPRLGWRTRWGPCQAGQKWTLPCLASSRSPTRGPTLLWPTDRRRRGRAESCPPLRARTPGRLALRKRLRPVQDRVASRARQDHLRPFLAGMTPRVVAWPLFCRAAGPGEHGEPIVPVGRPRARPPEEQPVT